MTDMHRVLILIPTYNERDNAERLHRDIMALGIDVDLLFIDDSSPDGTGEILDELAERHPNLKVVHRPRKLGIGGAHLDGIRWAYDNRYSTLITMDCDFTHRPSYLPRFLERSKDCDVVVGSRYLQGESLSEWSLLRKMLTRLGHLLTKASLGMGYDATGAFRVYRLDAIPRQTFDLVGSTGYSFFFESLYILHANGFSIRELPIELPARTYGHSKMRMKDAFDSLTRLARVLLTKLISPSRYRLAHPATARAEAVAADDVEAWDTYWLKPKTAASRIYGVIAHLYRKYIIKRNLNRLVGRHFPRGSHVLHAGCGSGEVDTDIPGELSVTALDISVPALQTYRRLHDDSCNLVRGTIVALPLADESVDGIYHLGVMEHFSEEEIHQILGEFNRVVKPWGKMIVFWPPESGLSVRFLKLVHFALNNILKRNTKLHPDEVSLLRSKSHAEAVFGRARFAVEDYYFGLRDLFTHCMVVVSKAPEVPSVQGNGDACRPSGAKARLTQV